MKKSLIGDKRTFAIEYSILTVAPSLPFGDCRLWLGGNFLGGIEGEVYLTRVCHSLEGIVLIKNQIFLEDSLYNLSNTQLFDLMLKDEIDDTGKYWFMYTEGFDLFHKYVYRQHDIFYFLWKLATEVREEHDLQSFSTQLFSARVVIPAYEEVVKQFRNALVKFYNF